MANLLLAKKQCRNDLENNVFLGRAAYWVKRRLVESLLNRAVFPQFFQRFHAWGPKNTVFLRVFHHLVFLGYVTSNSIFEKRVVL
jgi:hypothetical protein